MIREIQVRIGLSEAKRPDAIKQKVAGLLDMDMERIQAYKILKKSIDARKPKIFFNYKVRVYIDEEQTEEATRAFLYKEVSQAAEIHIVGFGPAGMYAALRCIELGYKPVVIERGKKVKERRRDIKAINRDLIVDEDSNYSFGEGGAGTFSDGKLYTRSLKRGDVRKIFENLVYHGATEQILVDAHPHIGTNKLPQVVQNIRETILKYGGEIHFETRLTDLRIKQHKITGIVLNNTQEIPVQKLILATGHSARDIYYLLHRKGIALEAKSFAMGVRVEHPQALIDSIQYHCSTERDPLLPAASYNLVHQVNERGVYSFCMCPGGFIVPAATAPGEVVVNGMSPASRNSKFANSGMVVAIDVEKDIPAYEKWGVLKALEYQKDLERLAFNAGGRSQKAPAQRLTDFVEGRLSHVLNETSFQPGLTAAPLHSLLPKIIGSRLRKGFAVFGKKMPSFYTEQANVIGVESRTSSPVKIPRNNTMEHPEIQGLFPCGEGAGYAGGIISAAIDGERCAEAAIRAF